METSVTEANETETSVIEATGVESIVTQSLIVEATAEATPMEATSIDQCCATDIARSLLVQRTPQEKPQPISTRALRLVAHGVFVCFGAVSNTSVSSHSLGTAGAALRRPAPHRTQFPTVV